MNPPSPEAVALHRYGLLTKVQDLLHQRLPLSVALETVAAAPSPGPDGLEATVARRTLEDWWYAYKKGGFAALHPRSRSDRGRPRALTEAQQRFVLDQVRTHLAVPVKVLYRQWKLSDPSLPGLTCIYRWLERHDLHHKARRYQLRQSVSGPTKSFEMPAVNDLWMVDFSPGPFLTVSGRTKALATHLCAILDDHSRLIVAALYHARADTQAFHLTLKEALRRRGIPRAIYTDQGGPFTNDHTRLVCAKVGLRLLHARPYHSWSKGKIERFFRTCQEDFEASLRLPGRAVHSLDDLNARLADWLQSHYHARVHGGTDQTPHQRFHQAAHLIRSLDPTLDLDRLFHTELERVVRKDGTVRLGNQLYEVDLALRGLSVRLRFDPWTRAAVEVEYRGQPFGLARLVDPHLNSQLGASSHYEKP
jgi:transposase InsO family protein